VAGVCTVPLPSQDPTPETDERVRSVDRRRKLGRFGEQLAAAHLERLGYTILARNVRTRHGEIDLIGHGQHAVVVVEVKTRCVRSRTTRIRAEQEPLQWLHPRQRARLRRLAVAWLAQTSGERPSGACIRFDAIGVLVDPGGRLLRLDHVEGAW